MEILEASLETYAWNIIKLSKGDLSKNGIYTILTRMIFKGYLSDRLEEEGTGHAGPRRRFYKLTPEGFAALAAHRAAKGVLDAARVKE